MKKEVFRWGIFILIAISMFIPLVSASTDERLTVITQHSPIDVDNLILIYPKHSYYPVEDIIRFNFHATDFYNYIYWNTQNNQTLANCGVHLYNQTGHHILEDVLTPDLNGIDWYFDYQFNETGYYYYTVACVYYEYEANDTLVRYAAFVSNGFEITSDGYERRDMGFLLGILALIPLIICIILMYGASLMSEEHGFIKLFMWFLAFPMLFLSNHMASMFVIRYLHLEELANLLGNFTFYFGMVFFSLLCYFLLYMIIKYMTQFGKGGAE